MIKAIGKPRSRKGVCWIKMSVPNQRSKSAVLSHNLPSTYRSGGTILRDLTQVTYRWFQPRYEVGRRSYRPGDPIQQQHPFGLPILYNNGIPGTWSKKGSELYDLILDTSKSRMHDGKRQDTRGLGGLSIRLKRGKSAVSFAKGEEEELSINGHNQPIPV